MKTYIECIKYLRDNNIKSIIEYNKLCKLVSDIPKTPNTFYREWIDWYEFLSKERKKFLSFIEANNFIKNLNLKSISDYRNWYKSNINNLPNSPDSFYNEWISWSDFLGHDYIATSKREFLSFNEAREIARNLELKTQKEWQKWIIKNKKEFKNIPTCPEQVYDEFISYNDWLGTTLKTFNGENIILNLLIKNNISYVVQKKFDDCRYKRTLPFDFYLPDLNICIEYDGKQHFEPIFGQKELENTKIRDDIKTNYCLNNNIKLIRISYLEDIEEKLISINENNFR